MQTASVTHTQKSCTDLTLISVALNTEVLHFRHQDKNAGQFSQYTTCNHHTFNFLRSAKEYASSCRHQL